VPRVAGDTAITFAIFWLIQVGVILKGLEGIKQLESWSAPLLLAAGPLLLAGPIRAAAAWATCCVQSEHCASDRLVLELFPPALTASVGYWATLSLNIPDFTRYARASAPRCWARRWASRPR
jgi:NCS1 family nucleobase:cation symporter-1